MTTLSDIGSLMQGIGTLLTGITVIVVGLYYLVYHYSKVMLIKVIKDFHNKNEKNNRQDDSTNINTSKKIKFFNILTCIENSIFIKELITNRYSLLLSKMIFVASLVVILLNLIPSDFITLKTYVEDNIYNHKIILYSVLVPCLLYLLSYIFLALTYLYCSFNVYIKNNFTTKLCELLDFILLLYFFFSIFFIVIIIKGIQIAKILNIQLLDKFLFLSLSIIIIILSYTFLAIFPEIIFFQTINDISIQYLEEYCKEKSNENNK